MKRVFSLLSELLKKGYLLRIFSVKVKPCAKGRNIVGQQLPTLMDVTCCVPFVHPVACCCVLLGVVGNCCAKFETGQTFSYVQTDAATPNIVGSRSFRLCSLKSALQVELTGYSLF